MVDKVYQRRQTLRKQVKELKIEIDEVRRRKDVVDIVETDFFRDLQSKARGANVATASGGWRVLVRRQPEGGGLALVAHPS